MTTDDLTTQATTKNVAQTTEGFPAESSTTPTTQPATYGASVNSYEQSITSRPSNTGSETSDDRTDSLHVTTDFTATQQLTSEFSLSTDPLHVTTDFTAAQWLTSGVSLSTTAFLNKTQGKVSASTSYSGHMVLDFQISGNFLPVR